MAWGTTGWRRMLVMTRLLIECERPAGRRTIDERWTAAARSLLRAAELWEKESKTASRFRDVGMTHGRPAGKPSETKRGSGGWAQEEGPRRRWGAPAGGGGDGALLGAVWLPRPVTREGYFTTR